MALVAVLRTTADTSGRGSPIHSLGLKMIASSPASVSGAAQVVSNFAWQHMRAAVLFREHVCELERQHMNAPFDSFFEIVRCYASACLMSASAAIEGLINELFISPESGLRGCLMDFEREYWGRNGIEGLSPLEKYQRALDLLGLPRMNEADSPFLDADALIRLRNALVHYKPTWDPARPRKVDLVATLNGRYKTCPFLTPESDFVTMQSMSADCCRWAASTAASFIRDFQARSGLDSSKLARISALEA